MNKQFQLSDIYSVEKRNRILEEKGLQGVRTYLEHIVDDLIALVEDAPSEEERANAWDDVFGTIFSAALDHEVLATYFIESHNSDINEGGLSDNVIRLLKELEMRRTSTPFSG